MTDRHACFDITQKIKERHGKIDILVNAAGVYKARAFLDYAPSDFSSMLDVNLFGTINLIQAVLPGMAQRSYGRIVNIASTAGKWGSLNQSAYNVSKHAAVGLTRCVALEFAKSGVTVNAICPGMVQTDLADQLWQQQATGDRHWRGRAEKPVFDRRVPLGRHLAADEVAWNDCHFVFTTRKRRLGQSLLVDGGLVLV